MLTHFLPRPILKSLAIVTMMAPLFVQAAPDAKTGDGPAGAAFALVKDGKALAPLVLAADATPRNREAAKDLADAIRKISGAEVKIIEASPAEAPERAVWIGLQPGLEKLFPGVDLKLTQPEEVRIVSSENHLLIAGRDLFDPKLLGKDESNDQWEYGTANAVYTFIQEPLGVRWLFPGPVGTEYPASAVITVPPTNFRYHPQFQMRMGIFAGSRRDRNGEETTEWMRHQRLLLDSLDANAGHPFVEWWDTYGASHPEFFALQPDGTRGTFPVKPGHLKLCQGEPKVWEAWLKETEETIKENPMQTVFSVSENDGSGSGLCVDPRSQAWDPPMTEGTPLVTYNYAHNVRLERPPISDRYITFANKLDDLLMAKYPDSNFNVAVSAYGGVGRPAPLVAKPNDNVIILGVHNFLLRGKAEREQEMANFDAWSNVTKKLIWRPNLGGSSGIHWGTTDVAFTRVAHDFKWVAERHTIGIFIDTLWNHWGTQGPLYYLMAQLAWNPDADPDAIVKDFCERSYGPAGKTMLSYWRLMEEMRNRIEDESPTRWRMLESPRFYTAEFFKKAQDMLTQAASETAEGTGNYGKRVELAQAGLEYTEMVIDTRAAMQTWEDSKKTDEKAKAHVLANWARTEEMRKTFPEYAINWKWVFRNDKTEKDPKRRRSFGLHPRAILSPKFMKEFRDGGAAKDEME